MLSLPRICFLAALVSITLSVSAADVAPAFDHKPFSLSPPPVPLTGAAWAIDHERVVAIGGRHAPRALHLGQRDGGSSWRQLPAMLPTDFRAPIAVSTPGGLLIIDRESGQTVLLQHSTNDTYIARPLAPLPPGQRAIAVASARGIVFAVAGTPRGAAVESLKILQMPLAVDHASGWREAARVDPRVGDVSAVAAQHDGVRVQLYVLGTTGFLAFDPDRARWLSLPPPPDESGLSLLAPVGIAHVYAFSGNTPRKLHVFNTITRQWIAPRSWPIAGKPVAFAAQGTTMSTLTLDDDGRASWLESTYTVRARGLHRIDYVLMATFLGGLVGLAVFNRKRFKSADSYFRGGKNIPWLAAGLSVVATGQSATSFISIPARSFATNWQFSLVEQTLSVIGLFGGGLGGLFLLGMLTTRVSARGALAGFVVSAAVQYYVSRHTALHWLTYMFTGMGSCFAAGWLASFVWPEHRKLEGLTVHTCA